MDVFLYGTLLDAILFERIAGPGDHAMQAAILHDHVVLAQVEQPIPVLVARPGQVAHGVVKRGLNAAQLERLDAYELPFGYTLRTVEVLVDGVAASAMAYYPGPGLDISDRIWEIAAWDAEMGALTREAAVEIAAMDPPLAGNALAQQWQMIAKRAAARLRAHHEPQPAKVRRVAEPDDVKVVAKPAISGNFFRLAGHTLTHRSFAGGQSDVLQREVFIGTDAALVLPYDPVTDRVLLVEQFRMGPWARGAANPWALEPVAGMIDAGETPEEAGLRESEEEAGLTGLQLEKMFSVYASPGGATDYFYCFAGLCPLPEPTQFCGGLDVEHEDLRLHVLPFDQAYGLIASGEANIGPLVAMLLWLDRERPRLRAAA